MSDDENGPTIEMDLKGLDLLEKLLKGPLPVARIGILGGHNQRNRNFGEPMGATNAEIGVKHEYGLDGMPMRSFLRTPLMEHMQGYLDKAGAFEPQAINNVMKERSFLPFVKKLAVLGEIIVQDAFKTGGFGKWPKSDMRFKKNHQTLVETQQLRNSITSEVK